MATVEKEREVMTTEELAEFLRVPEAIVRQYAGRFHIHGRQIGPEWRFWRIAIQDWLRGRTGKEALLSQAGAFEDDAEDLAELRAAIYRDRGRSEVEEGP
jgi:hypothetical protein